MSEGVDRAAVSAASKGGKRGPINSIREGIELAERLGLEPRVTLGEGDRAVDLVRNPVRFSNASVRYDQPPPALGEHGDEIRAWLATPVSGS